MHIIRGIYFSTGHIRQFDDNAWNNWKEILDKNSKTFWNDIKDKFISAEFQHAINVIESIIGSKNNLFSQDFKVDF